MDPKVVAANIPPGVSRQVVDRPVIIDRLASASAMPDTRQADMQLSAPSSNPTVLPDSFMESVIPLVLIRHRARFIPSFYRAASEGRLNMDVNDEDFPVNASLRWSRLVFDWYADRVPTGASSSSRETLLRPIVLDAGDFINDENVVRNLCYALRLDPLHLQFSWKKGAPAELQRQSPMVKRFHSTLQESTGIIRTSGKDEEIDIAKEAEDWTKEFGSQVGRVMKKYAELAMHDYCYLREFRLRPS